ncbi:MAG: hypothetical protein HGN29_08350 [Asgard group archaeon]|nr:hypothetical protein [Asgard group archaeon]
MTRSKTRNFDNIDLQIIRTIDEQFDKQNYSPATEQISELLEKSGDFDQKIPPRTIRYRIFNLKEKGILQKKIPITHERKLGIGESIFVVEENPKYRTEFYDIIDKNEAIDWYVPTYGKYNGYYLHSIYSLDSSYHPHKMFRLLKEKDIIRDYSALNIVDYKTYSWNFKYFDEDGSWYWNWEIWKRHLQNKIKSGNELVIEFDTEPERMNFDFIDIQILRNMYLLENLPLKKLEAILDLSESQIGRRIKIMEQKGIIRGYRTGFYPFEYFPPLFIVIEAKQNIQQILYHVSKIPYPLTIALDKPGRIGLAIEFPSYEIREFLDAFYLLKPLIDSYFIQLWSKIPDFNIAGAYDLFEEESNSFVKLDKEYERTLSSIEEA